MDTLEKIPEASVFSLQSFDHGQRVAKMLSSSTLIPKEYQGNIQNTMIALEMANRIGASPLMVMQNLYIVKGKPGWSSQFIIATVNNCGRFKALRFDLTGTINTADRKCIAWTVDRGVDVPKDIVSLSQAKLAGIQVIEGPEVTMAMAKAEGWIDKDGSKWKTMPDIMLRYRSATFWGRLYTPELLMGMQTAEEIIDITPAFVPDVVVEEITPERLQQVLDDKVEFLTKKEFDDAKRIIATKEVLSYKKLLKLLTSKSDADDQPK